MPNKPNCLLFAGLRRNNKLKNVKKSKNKK